MYVVCVQVNVKENFVSDFIEATRENAENTRKEEGCLRFDILQQTENPALFTLYEVYHDETGMAAHKETPHYNKWRNTVAEWMAETRTGIKHNSLYPEDPSEWQSTT
ncbi:MAG: putative quinol monooxygenase [Planctomycetota bacterium]|jgi:autoinducer 2-degrading protein